MAIPSSTRSSPAIENRRRDPRFDCNGFANVVSLPSDGMFLQGLIRNVSRGGCFIETGLELPRGTLAEILARIDSSCFRALGQVRAIRQHSGIGVEFVRLSAGAKYMLSELVEFLERAQPRGRNVIDGKPDGIECKEEVSAENFPVLRNFPAGAPSRTLALVTDPDKKIIEARILNDPLDLFI